MEKNLHELTEPCWKVWSKWCFAIVNQWNWKWLLVSLRPANLNHTEGQEDHEHCNATCRRNLHVPKSALTRRRRHDASTTSATLKSMYRQLRVSTFLCFVILVEIAIWMPMLFPGPRYIWRLPFYNKRSARKSHTASWGQRQAGRWVSVWDDHLSVFFIGRVKRTGQSAFRRNKDTKELMRITPIPRVGLVEQELKENFDDAELWNVRHSAAIRNIGHINDEVWWTGFAILHRQLKPETIGPVLNYANNYVVAFLFGSRKALRE